MTGDTRLKIALAELDLLEVSPGALSTGREPTIVLARAGSVPVGRLELLEGTDVPARRLSDAITLSVAEETLRAGLAALLNDGLPAQPVTVTEALQAARAHAALVLPGPAISVAVCTRDRVVQLERALASIERSLGAADELVVIDNASGGTVVEDMVRRRFPSVRLVPESRPGLDWARNRAIVESRGDVIAFCDDDCVMSPGTLTALRAIFARNPDVDAVTGLVEPLTLATPAHRLFDRYLGSNRRYRRRWVMAPNAISVARHVGNVGQYGTGASLSIRRTLFKRVGVFDAALGTGSLCAAGDDMEFLFRMLKAGALLAYEPRVFVRHEHRREVPELEAQLEGWSRGFACAVERSTLAFPEERLPYAMLLARIGLFHHARRATTEPAVRRLAWAELRGMFGAKRTYAASRLAAEAMARLVPSPAGDARPDEAGSRARRNKLTSWRTSRVQIDLAKLQAVDAGAGVETVRLDLRLWNRSLGGITVGARNGFVGLDRLHDLAIDRLAPELLARPWRDAVDETRVALQARLGQACAAT